MKKKLLSFIIAAAITFGIPAAIGSTEIKLPSDSPLSPAVAEATTTTNSIGTSRHSATSGTVSAYASFDCKAKKAVCTIELQEKYKDAWRTAKDIPTVIYTKIVYDSYSITASKKFALKSGKVYRAKIVFSDKNSSGTHYKTRYTGAF